MQGNGLFDLVASHPLSSPLTEAGSGSVQEKEKALLSPSGKLPITLQSSKLRNGEDRTFRAFSLSSGLEFKWEIKGPLQDEFSEQYARTNILRFEFPPQSGH